MAWEVSRAQPSVSAPSGPIVAERPCRQGNCGDPESPEKQSPIHKANVMQGLGLRWHRRLTKYALENGLAGALSAPSPAAREPRPDYTTNYSPVPPSCRVPGYNIIRNALQVGMPLPPVAKNGSGKEPRVASTRPRAPVEIRVACHAPTVPAYRRFSNARRYMLHLPMQSRRENWRDPPGPSACSRPKCPCRASRTTSDRRGCGGFRRERPVGFRVGRRPGAPLAVRALPAPRRGSRPLRGRLRPRQALDLWKWFQPRRPVPCPSRLLKWSFRRPEEGS